MQIIPTRLPDVKLVTPTRHRDDRGHFVEVFNHAALLAGGIDMTVVQENQSLSTTVGTVRGLHYQCPPAAQAKLVRVLKGRIWDIAVDIRAGSPTYGKWVAEELSAENGRQLYVPHGFAHGFCTLDADSEIAYLLDTPYSPACDRGIRWNDPALAIAWPDGAGQVLSDKDARAPRLCEVEPEFHYGA
jgi:dTDP-4-dehydrorhamnose 3,5-epimerase